MHYRLINCLFQADLSKKESQIADLQENIQSQQAETSKEKDEMTSTLTTMEQLKENFNKERAGWDAEKATLVKQAEDVEAALNPVVEELTSLKQQVNAMNTVVFGKYPLHKLLDNNLHDIASLLMFDHCT